MSVKTESHFSVDSDGVGSLFFFTITVAIWWSSDKMQVKATLDWLPFSDMEAKSRLYTYGDHIRNVDYQ